jgi:hypothetical protein
MSVAFVVETRIAKRDGLRQIAYGVVLEPRDPDNPDSQGDWYSREDIEDAFHAFHDDLAKSGFGGDLMHDGTTQAGHPHDSFIAPVDFPLGDQIVKAGSWVMGMHYPDPAIWSRVQKGELGAFSVGGTGTRIYEVM